MVAASRPAPSRCMLPSDRRRSPMLSLQIRSKAVMASLPEAPHHRPEEHDGADGNVIVHRDGSVRVPKYKRSRDQSKRDDGKDPRHVRVFHRTSPPSTLESCTGLDGGSPGVYAPAQTARKSWS